MPFKFSEFALPSAMQFNARFFLIVAALAIFWKLDFFTTLLNMKALNPTVPDIFKDVVDQDSYEKSQEYTRVRSVFGIGSATFSLVWPPLKPGRTDAPIKILE